MTFLSPEFALFVVLGFLVFHVTPGGWRAQLLLGLSYLYYVSWSPVHALLLLAVTLVVYVAARVVDAHRLERRKLRTTTLSVGILCTLLVGFKSAGLIADAFGSVGTPTLLIAPLGLSYYLFKLIGYLLDVYWEKLPCERNFFSLALYAAFFPQIVSGPIQRAGDFFAQLPRIGSSDPEAIVMGLRRILFGLFKKLVLADRLAIVAHAVHANPSGFSSLELLLGGYAFALQLYVDFSGITDIAIGLGLLFGLRGPENFRLPYFARDLPEFWRRWHISLTSWLSDYLFVPLRMSLRKFGDYGLAAAVFINMLAVGLWHGPKATNAAFGAVNGIFLVIAVLTQKKRNMLFRVHPAFTRLRRVLGPLLTFHLVVFALIIFRAESMPDAFEFISHLVPGRYSTWAAASRLDWTRLGVNSEMVFATLLGVVAMEFVHWAQDQPSWRDRFLLAPRFVRWGLYYVVILIIGTLGKFGGPEFIYAQF